RPRLDDRKGARGGLERLLGRAEAQQADGGIAAGEILEEGLDVVGRVADAVAVGIEADVVAPVVAAAVLAEAVELAARAAEHLDLEAVGDEDVAGEEDALDR